MYDNKSGLDCYDANTVANNIICSPLYLLRTNLWVKQKPGYLYMLSLMYLYTNQDHKSGYKNEVRTTNSLSLD